MPYAPELGLRSRSFQWLSLVHIGTRHRIWSTPKPNSGRIAHAVAWLPVNWPHDVGTGTPGVAGGRAAPRLAPCCLRAASSAALAAAAHARHASRVGSWGSRPAPGAPRRIDHLPPVDLPGGWRSATTLTHGGDERQSIRG